MFEGVSKVPRLDLQTRIYLLDLSLGSTPFKTVPLWGRTAIPAPLPPLKSRSRSPTQDLLHSVKAATLYLQLHVRDDEEVARGQIW
jgi:hypothetical protein